MSDTSGPTMRSAAPPHEVAEALVYLLHMVEVLADGNKPDAEDIAHVKELITTIRNAR